MKALRWELLVPVAVARSMRGQFLFVQMATTVPITDQNRAAAEEVARLYGIPKIAEDAREIFGNPEIEAVLICSSTNTHAGLIIYAAKGRIQKLVCLFFEQPVPCPHPLLLSPLGALDGACNPKIEAVVGHLARQLAQR